MHIVTYLTRSDAGPQVLESIPYYIDTLDFESVVLLQLIYFISVCYILDYSNCAYFWHVFVEVSLFSRCFLLLFWLKLVGYNRLSHLIISENN